MDRIHEDTLHWTHHIGVHERAIFARKLGQLEVGYIYGKGHVH